jgi:hypothetical protein
LRFSKLKANVLKWLNKIQVQKNGTNNLNPQNASIKYFDLFNLFTINAAYLPTVHFQNMDWLGIFWILLFLLVALSAYLSMTGKTKVFQKKYLQIMAT